MNLFVTESDCFTAQGYAAYWEAVDKTVKYCDTILIKKLQKQRSNPKSARKQPGHRHKTHEALRKQEHYDKYHWSEVPYHQLQDPPNRKTLPSPSKF